MRLLQHRESAASISRPASSVTLAGASLPNPQRVEILEIMLLVRTTRVGVGFASRGGESDDFFTGNAAGSRSK